MSINPFTAADEKSSAAVSRIFGERLRLLPMIAASGFSNPTADPNRATKDFNGVLSGALGDQNLDGGTGSAEGFGQRITTRDRSVSVESSLWPAYATDGDYIQALDQPGQPLFEITGGPRGDGSGNRFIVPLVRL